MVLQRAVLAEGKTRVEGAVGAEARNELGDLAARTRERVAAADLNRELVDQAIERCKPHRDP